MKIKLTVSLKGAIRQDTVAGGFVTYCPALRIYAHGQDAEEAMSSMQTTIALYLETCLHRKTLDTVLGNLGFAPVAGHAAIPVSQLANEEFIAIEELKEAKYEKAFDIEVPIHLLNKAYSCQTAQRS